MRIVPKPVGLTLLLLAIGVLAVLAYFGMAHKGAPTSSAPVAPRAAQTELIDTNALKIDSKIPGAAAVAAADLPIPGVADPVMTYRVTLSKPVNNPADVTLTTITNRDIKKGDALTLHFQARSASSTPFSVVCQQSTAPNTKAFEQQIKPSGSWQEYSLPFSSPADFTSGTMQVSFQCGYKKGTVDIADVRLELPATQTQ